MTTRPKMVVSIGLVEPSALAPVVSALGPLAKDFEIELTYFVQPEPVVKRIDFDRDWGWPDYSWRSIIDPSKS